MAYVYLMRYEDNGETVYYLTCNNKENGFENSTEGNLPEEIASKAVLVGKVWLDRRSHGLLRSLYDLGNNLGPVHYPKNKETHPFFLISEIITKCINTVEGKKHDDSLPPLAIGLMERFSGKRIF